MNAQKHISDIVLTLHIGNRKDTFLMEAQISDDLDMVLRVFNYSTLIALEKNPQGAGEKEHGFCEEEGIVKEAGRLHIGHRQNA